MKSDKPFRRKLGMTDLDVLGMLQKTREETDKLIGCTTIRKRLRPIAAFQTMDELLERDREREEDGFPRKIKFRRVLVGPGKVITIPYVEEAKLIHGDFEPKKLKEYAKLLDKDEKPSLREVPGHGEGEEGDIIGEIPIFGEGGGGEGPEAGDELGLHEEAYEYGKELSEKFQLPNLKEKRKKVPSEEYAYDLTDRHEESGQVLDEDETLERILETNLILGRVDKDDLDTTKMIAAPEDEVYRVLSRERVWISQAQVFFLRDYSGSMWGEPTKTLVDQHLMIYSWLLVQYKERVIPRFIVHAYDKEEAKEVSAKEYFGLTSGGGTLIASGYRKINEIIESEGLERNYNIYVFQGTDGEDFDSQGKEALPEIRKILGYVNRMGVCVLKHPYRVDQESVFEKYLKEGGILENKELFRMHVMASYNVSEEDNIKAVKVLIAQD